MLGIPGRRRGWGGGGGGEAEEGIKAGGGGGGGREQEIIGKTGPCFSPNQIPLRQHFCVNILAPARIIE